MLSGQIVTGTFQTTDADTVTADGEIKLTYAGTDNLQPGILNFHPRKMERRMAELQFLQWTIQKMDRV